MLLPYEIIAKKRRGDTLTPEEIRFFFQGYVRGDIPDYQMAALLMAIYFQGMDSEETSTLVDTVRYSGEVLDLSDVPGPKVDKHSTGGVGDKVSLVLAPLVAAAGVKVPMISGRGLGHSGGTLDKLEAIPGFRTQLSAREIVEQLKKVGAVLVGQTPSLVPADQKLYALRDATATIESPPLVAASIMSKKLAEDLDALVLDVKTGNGAFFPRKSQALELGQLLMVLGERAGLRTAALLTSMEQPLGHAVGNWLETREAVQALQGQGPTDLMEIVLALGGLMLLLAGKAETPAEGMGQLQKLLESGAGFDKFLEIIRFQGGDTHHLEHLDLYPLPDPVPLVSDEEGFVSDLNAYEVGMVAVLLGAGRRKKEDAIDYGAGIVLRKKIGHSVNKGEVLADLYTHNPHVLEEASERLRQAYQIAPRATVAPPLILGRITLRGLVPWDPNWMGD